MGSIGMGELIILALPCVGIGLLMLVAGVVVVAIRSGSRKDK